MSFKSVTQWLMTLKHLVSLLNPIIAAGTTALDTMLTVAGERDYTARLSERAIFVAVRTLDGKLVGCQSVEPFTTTETHAFDHVGVMGTYVGIEYQRQGIGRRLLETMFERARSKGYEKIFTYVRADNRQGWLRTWDRGFGLLGRQSGTRRSRGDISTRSSSSDSCGAPERGVRRRSHDGYRLRISATDALTSFSRTTTSMSESLLM